MSLLNRECKRESRGKARVQIKVRVVRWARVGKGRRGKARVGEGQTLLSFFLYQP